MEYFLQSQENGQHQLKLLSPRPLHLPSHLIQSHVKLWNNYCGHRVGYIDWLKPIPNRTTRLGNRILFRRREGCRMLGEASKISATVFQSDQKAHSLAKNMFCIICVCTVNIFSWRLRQDGEVSCLTRTSAVHFWRRTLNLQSPLF